MTHRDWLFTINNPTEKDAGLIHSWMDRAATYIACQVEVGELGTRHVQGYVEFNQPITLSRLRNGYHARAHWEARRGSQAKAISYCTKTESRAGEPLILGVPKEQGKRNDLLEVYDMVQQGRSLVSIV